MKNVASAAADLWGPTHGSSAFGGGGGRGECGGGRGACRTKETNLKMRRHAFESPRPRQGGFTSENCGLGPLTRPVVSFRGNGFCPDCKLENKR